MLAVTSGKSVTCIAKPLGDRYTLTGTATLLLQTFLFFHLSCCPLFFELPVYLISLHFFSLSTPLQLSVYALSVLNASSEVIDDYKFCILYHYYLQHYFLISAVSEA